MSSRIAQKFSQTKSQGRAALIPFIMGGDPDAALSVSILKSIADAGADLIEIGMPFSDPMADGPVIQLAGLRALKAGAHVEMILGMVRNFRKQDTKTPIILMGYYNPIFHMGAETFCQRAQDAGVDGLIIVDLPPEEEKEFTDISYKAGLSFIRLVAPTSKGRVESLMHSASGFVYYISVAGITGDKSAEMGSLQNAVNQLRTHTALPIAVGFGIKTPSQAKDVGQFADAVVVGSALVDVIAKAGSNAPAQAAAFVKSLAEALRQR